MLPVIERLARQVAIPISIDTSKAAVAQAAIDAGRRDHQRRHRPGGDPAMIAARRRNGRRRVRDAHAGHAADDAGQPDATTTSWPKCASTCAQRRDALVAAGIDARANLPRPRHRLRQDARAQPHADGALLTRFTSSAARCWSAIRGKGFSASCIGDKEADRTNATVGAALALAVQGVQILRVHDVRPVREALLAFEACGGIDG